MVLPIHPFLSSGLAGLGSRSFGIHGFGFGGFGFHGTGRAVGGEISSYGGLGFSILGCFCSGSKRSILELGRRFLFEFPFDSVTALGTWSGGALAC
jgi:hypothetical protein